MKISIRPAFHILITASSMQLNNIYCIGVTFLFWSIRIVQIFLCSNIQKIMDLSKVIKNASEGFEGDYSSQ